MYGYAGAASGGGSIYSTPAVTAASDAASSGYDFERIAARYANAFGLPSFDAAGLGVASSADQLLAGLRRSADVNTMVKRPRIESNLPVYPQRLGEKDCAFYMMTRTCKFGDSCKFDHPIWVPEGGIPDWKEIPLAATDEIPPERPGNPDCPYYMKTSKCKFGARCKFNHPKDMTNFGSESGGEETETQNISLLPERPSEPICSFYAKTGRCKYGATCKFHHPKDIQLPPNAKGDSATFTNGEPAFTPALLHNSKGLPIRPGETDCPFYIKTGSCKYGAVCRYNHPDRFAINPLMAPALEAVSAASLGIAYPISGFLSSVDLQQTPQLGQLAIYPQRPGAILCDFYMKTGQCKFAERCRFHHPVDRANPEFGATSTELPVKLTLAGLPRREGVQICPFYMKHATCKFGAACKFDHPPPGEAVNMVVGQGANSAVHMET